MADSVDRVFSHALNTVNKIRAGTDKPPARTRLQLYGLYKQSMEGNVEGIMMRPSTKDGEAHFSLEKWDAWKSCSGLSRTEAKRRYITLLIETMRKHATNSPDSRELVDELEFVWDQVKSNVSSSNSSSPDNKNTGLEVASSNKNTQSPEKSKSSPQFNGSALSFLNRKLHRVVGPTTTAPKYQSQDPRLLTGSPLSQSQPDQSSEDENDAEFHDAPDSQVAYAPSHPNPTFSDDNKSSHTPQSPRLSESKEVTKSSPSKKPPGTESKWRKKIESVLVKMTAEVAALREQLEAKSWAKARTRRGRIEQIGWSITSFFAKVIVVDLLLLLVILFYLRRKRDGRLEGAIRVLLGDAVAQVQRVGSGVQKQAQRSVGIVSKMALASTRRNGGNLNSSI